MATASVIYHYETASWWAESPEYPGWSAFGSSLDEVRALAVGGLPDFADDNELEILHETLPAVLSTTCALTVEATSFGVPPAPFYPLWQTPPTSVEPSRATA